MDLIPRTLALAALSLVAVPALAPATVFASSCQSIPALGQDYEDAKWVFTGRVVSAERHEERREGYPAVSVNYRATVEVERVFKQPPGAAVSSPRTFDFTYYWQGYDLPMAGLEEGTVWLMFLDNDYSWPDGCNEVRLSPATRGNREPEADAWLEVLTERAPTSQRLPDPWVFSGGSNGCGLRLTFSGGTDETVAQNQGLLQIGWGPDLDSFLRLEYVRVDWDTPFPFLAPSVLLTAGDMRFELSHDETHRSTYEPTDWVADRFIAALRKLGARPLKVQAEGFEPLLVSHALLARALAHFDACREALEPSE